MFRRRSASTATDSATAESASPEATEATQPKGYTPKKGVPTPKRRESEATPRRPLKAPETRKEAYRAYRERLERQRGLGARGSAAPKGVPKDEARYYRQQDLGEARAYARDYVDSRRSASEFFLPFSIVIIALLFINNPVFQIGVAYVAWPLMMVTIIGEGVMTGRTVKKRAAQYFPDDPGVRGVGMYAAMRQLQFRRLRLPKPRLKVREDPTPRGAR
ncbi:MULTISPECIES: DUF3043 domain-containing protein [unclassified Nocardiopsis]|uniref:DUF3043 domain-containing protein n=1 Tax=unclassified Nocardiopsis TaxID=2649073 RepID=UPI00135C89CB|nr:MULTISPECIES: DUF3043 domain-containing protein [unclassified Nocardiopsis]